MGFEILYAYVTCKEIYQIDNKRKINYMYL